MDLQAEINKLEQALEELKRKVKEPVPKSTAIVVSEWKPSYTTSKDIVKNCRVHILPGGKRPESVPVLTFQGIGYNRTSEDRVIPDSYTNHVVLTPEQEQEVFMFILKLAGKVV